MADSAPDIISVDLNQDQQNLSPSNENVKLANEKSEEDVCLIIDDKNEETESLRNTVVADTSLNGEEEATKVSLKDDKLTVEDSAPTIIEEETQKLPTEINDYPASPIDEPKPDLIAETSIIETNTNVPEVTLTSPSASNVESTSDDKTSKPSSLTELQTLTDVLTNKLTLPPKKPRQRKSNAAKKAENQIQSQSIIPQMLSNAVTIQMSTNGPTQKIVIPPGYKFNQSGQLVQFGNNISTPAAPMPPNTSQLRPASNHFFVDNNGHLLCLRGQPQPNQQLNKNSNQRKMGSTKEKDQANKTIGSVPQYQSTPMTNNYRLQVSSGIQQQSPNNLKNGNQSINGSQPISSAQKASAIQSTSTATSITQMSYMTPSQHVVYARAPLPINSGQRPIIVNQNNQVMNLVPVLVNGQYQLVAVPASLSVQQQSDFPRPPTLSPNPTHSDNSPDPTTMTGKKKKPGTSNGTSNGMFGTVSAKFLANISDMKSTHSKSVSSTLKIPLKFEEEKMEIDTDLNDDEPPPKIEREGQPEEFGQDTLLTQHQKAHNQFLHSAHQQHQQKLASQTQPYLKKHYIDGRVIEEEVQQFNSTQSSTKQRKVGQPPCSLPRPIGDSALRNTSKSVLNNFNATLNRNQGIQSKSSVQSRPFPNNFHPPPIVKPANYSPPTPTKDSQRQTQQIKKELKSPMKMSTNGSQKHKVDIRKSRGRPPKNFAQTPGIESDSSYDPSEPNTSKEKPKQKKNREVANLINMDFGPGKNPFETTSAESYTNNILTSRDKLQGHVNSSGYDGRHSRASVTSNSSRQAANSRRISQRQSSNLSPPVAKRPRRDAQRNIIYKASPDFEEEDDDDSMELDFKSEERRAPVNVCLYCKQPTSNPNLPQYCNKECKRKFKKKQHVEETVLNKCLNTSSNSTSSFKSEPATSTPRPSQSSHSGRLSLDNSTFMSKIDSFNTSKGSSNEGDMDMTSQEIDALKKIPIDKWTIEHVARWAELVCGSIEVGEKFREQDIDGSSLPHLNENDFKQHLGLKLGPCKKLIIDLKKIKLLNGISDVCD